MAGLDPAIHVFLGLRQKKEVVDARDKPGHDKLRVSKTDAYSETAFSEICQSLPSKTEMCSVFIGE
jgi:hypothetical protein